MPTIAELTLGVFKSDPYAALEQEIAGSVHPHPRTRIRHNVLARLRAAAREPDRIVNTSKLPTDLDALPLTLLYALREPAPTLFAEGPRTLLRTVFFVLHTVAAERELPVGVPLEDVIDAFARVVEVVLLNDHDAEGVFFGGEAAGCALAETDIATVPQGERVVVHARVALRVTYQDEIVVPVTDVLQVMNVEWDLGPRPDGQLEARDRMVLPIGASLAGSFRLVGDMTVTIG